MKVACHLVSERVQSKTPFLQLSLFSCDNRAIITIFNNCKVRHTKRLISVRRLMVKVLVVPLPLSRFKVHKRYFDEGPLYFYRKYCISDINLIQFSQPLLIPASSVSTEDL